MDGTIGYCAVHGDLSRALDVPLEPDCASRSKSWSCSSSPTRDCFARQSRSPVVRTETHLFPYLFLGRELWKHSEMEESPALYRTECYRTSGNHTLTLFLCTVVMQSEVRMMHALVLPMSSK
ncbi:hypothetical protein KC19_3G091900 [Ceratodon purpureus]|uniref:Uncharacterized protein n=1 Tax=Ceratodon purpureus TaxID=3225 RepID=A0A8T0IJ17_CERPU|nr:hypothetical protein KC19_3G091900 [Ceratodon purpureus]